MWMFQSLRTLQAWPLPAQPMHPPTRSTPAPRRYHTSPWQQNCVARWRRQALQRWHTLPSYQRRRQRRQQRQQFEHHLRERRLASLRSRRRRALAEYADFSTVPSWQHVCPKRYDPEARLPPLSG